MAEYTIKDSLSSVAEYIGEAVATKENAFRVSTMPAASADYAGEIYQYVGATDASYTNGYYYECAEDNGVYGWQQINVQPSNESGQTIQYDQMPEASEDNEDDIIQYSGETTANYTNGYFYKCVAQGTDPETYAWEQTNLQPSGEGMGYVLVTKLPTQNIDTETIYAIKQSKNEIISDGSATSITVPYGSASGSKSYHSLYDIEAGTVLDISVSFSEITVNATGCRINVVINGVSTTIANGTITGSTATISVQYTLNDDFVAARDTFVIVVDHIQWAGDITVNIGKLSILGYVPRKEYDYDYYFNTDGTSDGWVQIALVDKVDDKIDAKIVDKEDKFRLTTMPTASSSNVGEIIQYTGVTNANYIHGYSYECVNNNGTYSWQSTKVQNDASIQVLTALPTQNIRTDTFYRLKLTNINVISDGASRSHTQPVGQTTVTQTYHSSSDIPSGTTVNISTTVRHQVFFLNMTISLNVVINGTTRTITKVGSQQVKSIPISVSYTLPADFVASRDTFTLVFTNKIYVSADTTITTDPFSVSGLIPKPGMDYTHLYYNIDGITEGWKRIALLDDIEET